MSANRVLVDKIATMAARFHGLLFGGVVRDCILLNEVQKDIDIWFTVDGDVQHFIVSLENAGYVVKETFHDSYDYRKELYTFARRTYHVDYDGGKFYLDLICHDTFPVNDFYNNMLTYDGQNMESLSTDKTLDEIVQINKSKLMIPTPEYITKVDDSKKYSTVNSVHHARIGRFMSRGWTNSHWSNAAISKWDGVNPCS